LSASNLADNRSKSGSFNGEVGVVAGEWIDGKGERNSEDISLSEEGGRGKFRNVESKEDKDALGFGGKR